MYSAKSFHKWIINQSDWNNNHQSSRPPELSRATNKQIKLMPLNSWYVNWFIGLLKNVLPYNIRNGCNTFSNCKNVTECVVTYRFSMHSEDVASAWNKSWCCLVHWCSYLGDILIIHIIFMNKCITLALFKADSEERVQHFVGCIKHTCFPADGSIALCVCGLDSWLLLLIAHTHFILYTA